MGTRSLTHIVDEDGQALVTIYRQFDGYPTGMGADLKDILGGMFVRNGISGDGTQQFNGAGCLAASVIAGLKAPGGERQCGNVYLYPVGSRDCWEEFTYFIKPQTEDNWSENGGDGSILLAVLDYNQKVLFCGNIEDFDPETVEAQEDDAEPAQLDKARQLIAQWQRETG